MLPQLQMDDGSFPDEAAEFKFKNVHLHTITTNALTTSFLLHLSIFKYCYYQPSFIRGQLMSSADPALCEQYWQRVYTCTVECTDLDTVEHSADTEAVTSGQYLRPSCHIMLWITYLTVKNYITSINTQNTSNNVLVLLHISSQSR